MKGKKPPEGQMEFKWDERRPYGIELDDLPGFYEKNSRFYAGLDRELQGKCPIGIYMREESRTEEEGLNIEEFLSLERELAEYKERLDVIGDAKERLDKKPDYFESVDHDEMAKLNKKLLISYFIGSPESYEGARVLGKAPIEGGGEIEVFDSDDPELIHNLYIEAFRDAVKYCGDSSVKEGLKGRVDSFTPKKR